MIMQISNVIIIIAMKMFITVQYYSHEHALRHNYDYANIKHHNDDCYGNV